MSIKSPKLIIDKNGKQNTVYISATPPLPAPKRLSSLLKSKGKKIMSSEDAERFTDVITASKIGFLLKDSDREKFANAVQYAKSFIPVDNSEYSEIKIKNYDESVELTIINHRALGIWNVLISRAPNSAYPFDSADNLRNQLKRVGEEIRLANQRK